MAKETKTKIVNVTNAYGDKNTTAQILVQNKIKYTPKVSVIIPVYNTELYLRQCMDSVVNQTLREIEIICVDDGSTDKSLEMLQEYAAHDERITILTQKNLHGGVARNAGIAVARGEYLSFLDSDDFFEPDMLAEMYTLASKQNLDICVCNADVYDEPTKKFQQAGYILRYNYIPKDAPVFNRTILRENIYKFTNPAVWTKLYKRDFVTKNKLYFQNLYTCNDIGMGMSATSLANRISVVNQVFVHYRRGSNVQVTKKRGKTAINIVHAYYYIKHHLTIGKLDGFIKTLNNQIAENIRWELSRCNSSEAKRFKKQTKELMQDDFQIFKSCFHKDNFIVHFVKHMREIIKSKRVKKMGMYEKFLYHNIRKNSVLLVEANPYHGECLPGMAKYFLDLGYNVDVIMNHNEFRLNPFCNFKDARVQLFGMDVESIKRILDSDIIEKYEHLYFNSDRIFDVNKNELVSYYNYFGTDLKLPEEKVINMVHTIEKYDENNFSHPAFFGVTLSELPIIKGKDLQIVNTHYFGEFAKHTKNDKLVKFVCVGNIESKRKNHSLLFDAIDYLLSKEITNFKINVIARGGNLLIPEKYQKFIEFLGRLDYKDMYANVNDSDFFLTLLDPENPDHNRYLTCGTSGSYQLIYGFSKPCLICDKFACDINMIDKNNAILYKKNSDLGRAMQRAIEMPTKEYQEIQNNIQSLAQQIYDQSLKNLENLLKTETCQFDKNTFISLGENCFVRTILVRHHTKCKRSEGELSYPFDLKVCYIKTVIKLLQSDFKGYFDDLSWDDAKKIWVNKKLNIMYNHDLDCDTKEKLISRYTTRIENMRMLKNKSGLVFVASTVNPDISIDDINQLYTVLKSTYRDIKFVFINISKSELKDIKNLNSEIFYKHIPNPYPNYWGEWYKEEFYNSKSGVEFECACNEFVRTSAKTTTENGHPYNEPGKKNTEPHQARLFWWKIGKTLKYLWECPIRIYDKYTRLTNKIKQIKNGK